MNSKPHSICAKVRLHGFYPGLCQGNSIVWRGEEGQPTFSYHLEANDNAWDNDCYIYSNDHQVFLGKTGVVTAAAIWSDWYYTPPIDTGVWYCVVSTYDGDTTRIYVDGVLKTRYFLQCTFTPSTDSMNFGKSGDGPPYLYWLNGDIDEVRLYNRPLNQAEVNMFCDSLSPILAPSCDTIGLVDTIHTCPLATVSLPATISGTGSVLDVHWSPATGISDTTIPAPNYTAGYTSVMEHITAHTLLPGNLVVNGDFSAGNSGFTSSYGYTPGPGSILNEGFYSVYNNPNGVYSGFTSFADHTSGTGIMLIINGGAVSTDLWCQTIPVTPNTDYDFSAWFANCSSVSTGSNSPILQFKINGIFLGSPTTLSSAPGVWNNINAIWSSGISTTASICIYNLATVSVGNDFVTDDISFQQYCTVTDSVYIAVGTNAVVHRSHDTSVCLPFSGTLNAPVAHTNYHWNAGSTSSTLTVNAPGTYWVTSDSACATYTDTFHVRSLTNPAVFLGNDTTLCAGSTITLSSTQPSGSAYNWSTGSTASHIGIASTGVFWLAVTDSGCTATDTIHIQVQPYSVVNLGPDTTYCTAPAILQPSGSYTSPSYLWSTGATSPYVSIAASGTYWVRVTDGGCSTRDTIHLVFITPPIVNLGPDTFLCYNGLALILTSLQPSGTNCLWSTGSTGDTIHVATNGIYWLQADNGCKASDTLMLHVYQKPLALPYISESICVADTVSLIVSSHSDNASDYNWNFAGANIITHNSDNSGPYYPMDNTGCICSVSGCHISGRMRGRHSARDRACSRTTKSHDSVIRANQCALPGGQCIAKCSRTEPELCLYMDTCTFLCSGQW